MAEDKSALIDDLYAAFETDEGLERNGRPIDYGKFVVDLARAGGSNDDFNKQFELVFKDVRTALEVGDLPEAEARKRFYIVYARAVVRRWRFRDTDGTLIVGLGRDKDGNVVEASEANLIKLWTKRHDLFVRIRNDAEKLELYQVGSREAVAGN